MKEYLLSEAEKESHSLLLEHHFFPAFNPTVSWVGKENKKQKQSKSRTSGRQKWNFCKSRSLKWMSLGENKLQWSHIGRRRMWLSSLSGSAPGSAWVFSILPLRDAQLRNWNTARFALSQSAERNLENLHPSRIETKIKRFFFYCEIVPGWSSSVALTETFVWIMRFICHLWVRNVSARRLQSRSKHTAPHGRVVQRLTWRFWPGLIKCDNYLRHLCV